MGNMISSLAAGCCDPSLVGPPHEVSHDDICTLCMKGNVDLVSISLNESDGRVDALGSAFRDDGPVGIRRAGDKYVLVEDPPPGRQYRATALHFAVLVGDVDVAHVLLENGADPTIISEQGFSALDMAPCLTHIPTMERIGGMLRKALQARAHRTEEESEQNRAQSSLGNMPTKL